MFVVDAAAREVEERERDARTIFCFNLPIKGTEDDIAEFFEKNAGEVEDVRLITDRHTRRSKGCGYVELKKHEDVGKALSCSGRQLLGQTIMVQATQSEKNRMAAIQAALAAGPTKIYIGGLHPAITEDDLRVIVTGIGPIEEINLHRDDDGESKGFCFVQFKKADDASRARQELNGTELAGQTLKVGVVNQPGVAPPVVHTPYRPTATGANAINALDDDHNGGLPMTAQARANLMANLNRDEPSATVAATTVNAAAAAAAEAAVAAGRGEGALVGQTPSNYVLLKNMFPPPGDERDDDFDVDDIREDVVDEVQQHGQVMHCSVDGNSAGEVYLKLDTEHTAIEVVKALNHRWFGGKLVTATFVKEDDYILKFPSALL